MHSLSSPLSLALVVGLTASLLPLGALAQEPTESTADTLTHRLDATIVADGSALAGDLEGARAYVAGRVSYESYDGVLKGALGSYLTGTANGADQALLLERLIEAGDPTVETRFASCTPHETLARELAARSDVTRSGRGLAIDHIAEVADEIDDEVLRGAIEELVEVRAAAQADAEQATIRLADELFRVRYAPAEPPTSVAPTHAWLQGSVDGTWVDLDTTSEDGSARCEAESTYKTMDEADQHVVLFRLTSEERADGQLTENELLAAEFPLAELAASRVGLLFGEPAGLVDVADPASELATYTPVLRIDADSVVGKPIQLPRPSDSLADSINEDLGGVTGLFDSLPNGTEETDEDAGGLFGDSGDDGELFGDIEEDDGSGDLFGDLGGSVFGGSDGGELTGLWLDIELQAPDGTITPLRSELLDRIGFAARAAGDTDGAELAPLIQAAGDYALTSSLWQIGLAQGEASAAEAAQVALLDPLNIDSYAVQLDSLLRMFPAIYRDMGGEARLPAVLVASLGPALDDSGRLDTRLALDALHVPATVPADEVAAARDAAAVIAAERFLAKLVGEAEPGVNDSGAVFERAADDGTAMAWLTPGDAIDQISASPEALARIQARLDMGFSLLVPEAAADFGDVSATAWWSVDPVSGVVRDEHENGMHAQVEYGGQAGNTLSTMDRFRKFGCRFAKPLATATLLLFLSTGAGPGSALYEPLSEAVEAAAAAREAEAGRKAAETAACALG